MSNITKTKIRETLKAKNNVLYRIKRIKLTTSSMTKDLFVDTLKTLKEIEDRSEFLSDEIGLDVTLYEDKFFQVIENLLKLSFNEEQLGIINLFLYQFDNDPEDWDGKITISKGNKEQKHPFKTPDDVWNVLQNLK